MNELKPSWQKSAIARGATNQEVKVFSSIMHHVRMGEARIIFVFGIVQNVVIHFLLDTLYIYRFVIGILPAEKKIVPYSSEPVSVLMVHDMSDNNRRRCTDFGNRRKRTCRARSESQTTTADFRNNRLSQYKREWNRTSLFVYAVRTILSVRDWSWNHASFLRKTF